MLTGPSNTGGQVQTDDCFRVGGCSSPVQQDLYQAAQNEYNRRVNRRQSRPRRKRQRPRIELVNDYERLPSDSGSNNSDDSSYTVDCIDCDQTSSQNQYNPQVTEQPTPVGPDTQESASRNRGWSTWDSWGSHGSEYHESEGFQRQPSRRNVPNSYYNQMSNMGQNTMTSLRNMGSRVSNQIGKYSYSMGCLYYSC